MAVKRGSGRCKLLSRNAEVVPELCAERIK